MCPFFVSEFPFLNYILALSKKKIKKFKIQVAHVVSKIINAAAKTVDIGTSVI